MKAHSGNKNDTETFKKLIKSHISSLKAAQKSRYWIGDSAEGGFRFLKSPDFLVASLFLKKLNE